MGVCRPNVISILNNDDHPSFAVRPVRPNGQENPIECIIQPPCKEDDHDDNYNSSYSSSSSPLQSSQFEARPTGSLSIEPRAYRYDPVADSCASPVSPGFSQRFKGLAVKPLSPLDSLQPLPSPPSSTGKESLTSLVPKPVRKSKYPCPYAHSRSCPATFTTSGHAARHGKKHTGEKSVFCPICSKAFTRKDNMNQHYRTHRRPGGAGLKQEPAMAAARRAGEEASQQRRSLHSLPYDSSPPQTASCPSASTSDTDDYQYSHISSRNNDINRKRASSYLSHRRFSSASSSINSTDSTTSPICHSRPSYTSASGSGPISIGAIQRDNSYRRQFVYPTSTSQLPHGLSTLANAATGPSVETSRD